MDNIALGILRSFVPFVARMNKGKQELAALGCHVQFIIHPETGNLGLKIPSEALSVVTLWLQDNPDFELELFTLN